MQTPCAYGRPEVRGVLRQSADDFQVEEVLGFEPQGGEDAEHVWLWIEKRGQNTPWVAQALAKWIGLHPTKVSFAGLKDRHALTRQWMSVYLGQRPAPDWLTCPIEGVSIQKAERSQRKLQRGRLTGNRFVITLRDLQADSTIDVKKTLERRLERLAIGGVPNFFGEQRFGRDNLERAKRLFRGELQGQRAKPKHGFYLSAARSYLFNAVLAKRVSDQTWSRLLPGDVAMLDGTQSFFMPEADQDEKETLQQRLDAMDIHPTGPLPGVGACVVSDEVAELESSCLAAYPELVEGLERFEVKAMRRSLRAPVQALEWHWLEGTKWPALRLSFTLSQGAFATTVIRELIAYEA